jgi:predicted  nucleic acid-binding Zn-ribbon protein
MRETLTARLQTLESEHQAGQKMLVELDDKRQKLTQTILRIEGAMEVLRELLAADVDEKAQ